MKKLKYIARKGTRIKSRGLVEWFPFPQNECIEKGWKWLDEAQMWTNDYMSIFDDGWTAARACHSVKAFKRQVRKSNLPVGTLCMLESKYIGHDIFLIKGETK